MAQTHTFTRVAVDDHIETGTIDHRVKLAISSVATLTFTAGDARTVAAGLLAAADELDPVDSDAVARTLALATNGGAV